MMQVTGAEIGEWAACAAALAAAGGLYFAWRTVRETVAGRREAEQDRRRQRLERVGDRVESIALLTENDLRLTPPGDSWQSGRNDLRRALIGFGGELPCCTALVEAGDAPVADKAVPAARDEVTAALARA